MITSKFDYRNLKRVNINGKRHYVFEETDSHPVASVTTILDITKPQADRDALNQWRNNIGKHRADEITRTAAARGTRMHKYLENYINSGTFPIPGSNPYAIQSNNMAKVIVAEGLSNVDEYWGTEVPVCHPNIYAGTTDIAMLWKGKPAIGDFKQTDKPKKEERIQDFYLQLVAYGEAHNILHGTDIRTGVIMMCSKDYEYQEFVIEDEEYDYYRKKWWYRVEEYFEL